ncbi:MAG: type I glyceraldehyde-3-phosphate dehydrogenase [Candidatus Buchananbacteria bacterium]|nr:type I glyceraldehyde-3-phosphate dehydrogenase [Candidatus Buchananbacteria bacterium]
MINKKVRRVAINGFGRIGRAAFKIALEKKNVQIVAINDLTDTRTLAYLLRYDTVYGRYGKKVTYDAKNLIVNGKKYPVYAIKEPAKLPWKALDVDVVLECTGVFEKHEDLKLHLKAGAKKVVLSAPAKGVETPTLVFGTDTTYDKLGKEQIVSNASCTTNCISPVIQILESKFGVEKAMMTTIHAYTATQKLVDSPDPGDVRRGRAAAANLVPSSTGAAKATTEVIPQLKSKFDGISIRVPVPAGSLSDITAILKKDVTVEQLNKAFTVASKQARYQGILAVTGADEELVSSDIVGTSYSAIVDTAFTRVVGGNLVKILAWYDNEWGYSNRLVEMAQQV